MSNATLKTWIIRLLAVVMVSAGAHTAQAHVTLNSPNGGETLTAGDEVTISWLIAIPHVTENWDVYYSVTGREGPWQVIAEDLPLGDPTADSVHTHTWTVPDINSTQVRIRVVQDNVDEDYEDISDASITIQGTADAVVVDDPGQPTADDQTASPGAGMCGAAGMAQLFMMLLGLIALRTGQRRRQA